MRYHRSGRERLRRPVVGQLDLDFEAMELPSEPGLQLNIYTAAEGTPTSDALKLLASWAVSQEAIPTERNTARLAVSEIAPDLGAGTPTVRMPQLHNVYN